MNVFLMKSKYFLPLIFLIFLMGIITYQVRGQTSEWKVKIGDKKTYTYTKYSREGQNTWTREITTESGKANVTMKKGLRTMVEITKLTSSAAYGKTTYNGEVTQIESMVTEVMKVYSSREDWEAAVEALGGFYKLEGDLLVFTSSSNTIMKWNINTGWLTYSYLKTGDSEIEMTEGSVSSSSPVTVMPILSALLFIAFIIQKRRVKI